MAGEIVTFGNGYIRASEVALILDSRMEGSTIVLRSGFQIAVPAPPIKVLEILAETDEAWAAAYLKAIAP